MDWYYAPLIDKDGSLGKRRATCVYLPFLLMGGKANKLGQLQERAQTGVFLRNKWPGRPLNPHSNTMKGYMR